MGDRMSEKEAVGGADRKQVIDDDLDPPTEPPEPETENAGVVTRIILLPVLKENLLDFTRDAVYAKTDSIQQDG